MKKLSLTQPRSHPTACGKLGCVVYKKKQPPAHSPQHLAQRFEFESTGACSGPGAPKRRAATATMPKDRKVKKGRKGARKIPPYRACIISNDTSRLPPLHIFFQNSALRSSKFETRTAAAARVLCAAMIEYRRVAGLDGPKTAQERQSTNAHHPTRSC